MSHEDIAAESKSATAGTSGSDDLRVRWWASLWLWPGVVIGLASIAEALFGVIGAILVSGEALAVVALFAGVVIFDRRHRPTVGAAAVCVASLAVLAGLALLQKAHHLNGGSLATETSPLPRPQTGSGKLSRRLRLSRRTSAARNSMARIWPAFNCHARILMECKQTAPLSAEPILPMRASGEPA